MRLAVRLPRLGIAGGEKGFLFFLGFEALHILGSVGDRDVQILPRDGLRVAGGVLQSFPRGVQVRLRRVARVGRFLHGLAMNRHLLFDGGLAPEQCVPVGLGYDLVALPGGGFRRQLAPRLCEIDVGQSAFGQGVVQFLRALRRFVEGLGEFVHPVGRVGRGLLVLAQPVGLELLGFLVEPHLLFAGALRALPDGLPRGDEHPRDAGHPTDDAQRPVEEGDGPAGAVDGRFGAVHGPGEAVGGSRRAPDAPRGVGSVRGNPDFDFAVVHGLLSPA